MKRRQAIYIDVIRADGRVERRGLVSFYHRNPVINWAGNFYIKLKERLRKW